MINHVQMPRYCPICKQALNQQEKVVCTYCMTQLPYTVFHSSADNPMIRLLWKHGDVKRANSLFYYYPKEKCSQLIISIKYLYSPKRAVQLGMMAARMKMSDWEGEGVNCIVPVPIHWIRRCGRGYNQAEQIAQGISAVYNLPVLKGVLRKYRHSVSQTKLHTTERWRNVQNMYSAHVPVEWRGCHIMLVDDVCTTGATLTACMQALWKSDPTLTISCFTLALTGNKSIDVSCTRRS